uniref:Protein kinase domain-containing protein n=1 Tax=Oryzias latipes TaxID=8090 RepID=A0A3P9JLG7_ORYLA
AAVQGGVKRNISTSACVAAALWYQQGWLKKKKKENKAAATEKRAPQRDTSASARRVRQKFLSTTNTVAPRTPLSSVLAPRAPLPIFSPLARAATGRRKSCLCRAIGLKTVETFLGEGAYGKVAKCKKLGTDQVVAIKIIWGSGQMEINALEELSQIDADDHNLVKFVESFKYKKYMCIAFEVLDQSLLDFMEKRDFHPLAVDEIRTIAWQLIVALKGLKSVNLVHCDIKLDNIMLVDQGSEPFRVKLIDLGLAEKIGHMRTGTNLWTVSYILFVLYTGIFIHGWDTDYNILRAMVKMQGTPEEKVLNQGVYTTRFFTKTKENSQDVWKLDTPQQQSRKKGRLVEDDLQFWSCDQLIHSCLDKTKLKEAVLWQTGPGGRARLRVIQTKNI